jgi:DNA-binding transcriptional ArsR family regulator
MRRRPIEVSESGSERLFEAAGLLKSLSHPLRLSIACGLRRKPCTQTFIAETLGIPQSTVAQHLRVLRAQGVVRSERRGIEVVFFLADPMVPQILDLLCQGAEDAEGEGFAWCELAELEKKRRVAGL